MSGSDIGGAIGTAAGAYFGGPTGAAIGSKVGSTAGGEFDGGDDSGDSGEGGHPPVDELPGGGIETTNPGNDNTAAYILGGGAALSGLNGLVSGQIASNRADREKKVKSDRAEDLGNRREATYRQDRAELDSPLRAYYAKQGWTYPENTLPGAGTAKQLPNENPLYSGAPGQPYPKFYSGPENANTPTGPLAPTGPTYEDANPAPVNDAPPASDPNLTVSPQPIAGQPSASPQGTSPQLDASHAIASLLYSADAAKKALNLRGG